MNETKEAKQFTFAIVHKEKGSNDQVRATAYTVEVARKAVVDSYGTHYAVADLPMRVEKAHRVLGEIDCT